MRFSRTLLGSLVFLIGASCDANGGSEKPEPALPADGVYTARVIASPTPTGTGGSDLYQMRVTLDENLRVAGRRSILVTFREESVRCDSGTALDLGALRQGGAVSFILDESSPITDSSPPAVLAGEVIAKC